MQTSPFSRVLKAAAFLTIILIGTCFFLLACGGSGGGGTSGIAGGSGTGIAAATFAVSGEIAFAGNTAIDGDVNDPDAPYASNDLFDPDTGLIDLDLVQRVSRLVTVGGYVNQPGQGAPGRSFEGGDISDFYVVDLTAGQTITLTTADSPTTNNVDLYLFVDQDFDTPVASSTSDDDTAEMIQVDSPGTYFIEVRAVTGATIYALKIAAADGLRVAAAGLGNDFVPGEVIVEFKDAGARSMSAAMVADETMPTGLARKAGEPGRAMLFGLNRPRAKAQSRHRLSMAVEPLPVLELDSDLQRRLQTLAVISELRSRADVVYAEPNYIRRIQRTPSDALFTRQWHFPLINLPAAWDTTTGDADVIVAVVDTGVVFDHPDLKNRLTATGYDFISDADSAMDGDSIDADPFDAAGVRSPGISIFHGSHVAGTIAAQTDNGTGVASAGWRTRVMPLRAIGKGGEGRDYDIMQAVRYAAGLPNDSGTLPPQKADIINLSLSGDNPGAWDFTEVREQGVIVVAAAGNFARRQPGYPAASPGVLAVSAVNINEQPAFYSNFGGYIDLAAPGGDLSDDLDGDGYGDGVLSTIGSMDLIGDLNYVYSYLEGTSMAAAHASGVIALMKAVNPGLTPDDLDGLVVSGSISRDLGAPGRDDVSGYGLIDAQKAVLAAAPARLSVSPGRLDFGTELSESDLKVEKIGPGPLTVLSVTGNAPWLTVAGDPAAGDGDFPAVYRVRVERSDLAPGDYGASIRIVSDSNTVTVRVTMKVAAPPVIPAEVEVSPPDLRLGDELSSAILTVDKEGTDALAIRAVGADAGWLAIQEITPGAGERGDFPAQYRVLVDRTGLGPGDYEATITIESNSNTVTVPVSMTVVSPTLLTASPASIFLGTTLTSADLTLGKDGSGPITFSDPEVDVRWLEIEAIGPFAGEPPAQFMIKADRTGLDPGDYEATITVASENNTVIVPVAMQVADIADAAAGTLYVQLKDPDTFETVYQQTVISDGGLCRFDFTGIAAGRYLIFAGTNLDNDALIGDDGEVFGAYLSIWDPVTLQVDRNLGGLDFSTGFNPALSTTSNRASTPAMRQEVVSAF
jgi:serine protease